MCLVSSGCGRSQISTASCKVRAIESLKTWAICCHTHLEMYKQEEETFIYVLSYLVGV